MLDSCKNIVSFLSRHDSDLKESNAAIFRSSAFNVIHKMMNEPAAEWRHAPHHHNGGTAFKAQPSPSRMAPTSNGPTVSGKMGVHFATNSSTSQNSHHNLLKFHTAISSRFGTKKASAVGDNSAPPRKGSVTLGSTKNHIINEGNPNLLDYTTTGSSSSNSGVEYKRRHRCTLPSITTTTTDTTTSDYSHGTGDSAQSRGQESSIDYHFLYADSAPPSEAATSEQNATSLSSDVSKSPIKENASNTKTVRSNTQQQHSSVRRVASFTYSPEGSSDKHNKRGNIAGSNRKFTLGPIGKTLNYIKNKVDTAMSTSALYPTKEECRLWQDSFEALLNHKYGCLLFRQFAKSEVSVENVDFWLDCEEYRKMKEGKKQTIQKAHAIYDTYIRDGAPKEVNLDSTTKAATKASLESGIRPDIFNLAQSRTENLMARETYQRFLKSELYLELLNGNPSASSLHAELLKDTDTNNSLGVILRTGSAKESPTRKPLPCNAPRRHTCVPENSNLPAPIVE
ncbi:regulator of G protein signaling domain-containing protein [Ditylenchus destructor]|nr:regulator of G protein signaling domain-containing protein [Ditylenchus destructor]